MTVHILLVFCSLFEYNKIIKKFYLSFAPLSPYHSLFISYFFLAYMAIFKLHIVNYTSLLPLLLVLLFFPRLLFFSFCARR